MDAEALFGDADDISLSSDDGEEERKGDEDKEREKDSDTELRRSDEDRSPRREETVRSHHKLYTACLGGVWFVDRILAIEAKIKTLSWI